MTAKCEYFSPSGEPAWWVTPATNSMLIHVTPLASATATRAAVSGERELCMGSRKCNYSGKCLNRTKGVRDVRAAEGVSDAAGEDDVCPLSMEKPIHARTPPPATMNASRDTPNNSNNRTPMSAATTRITNTVSATFVSVRLRTFIASDRCSAAERPASIRANMAPQMTGFVHPKAVLAASVTGPTIPTRMRTTAARGST
jgi:hypothetical protein